MKQLALFATSMLVSAFAFAAYPIEGTWGTKLSQNGFDFDASFTIQNNTITATNVCSYKGQTATARATAPATWDDKTITVTGSAKNEAKAGDLNCTSNIVPMKLNYSIDGSTLTLTMPGSSDAMKLDRR